MLSQTQRKGGLLDALYFSYADIYFFTRTTPRLFLIFTSVNSLVQMFASCYDGSSDCYSRGRGKHSRIWNSTLFGWPQKWLRTLWCVQRLWICNIASTYQNAEIDSTFMVVGNRCISACSWPSWILCRRFLSQLMCTIIPWIIKLIDVKAIIQRMLFALPLTAL